MSSRVRKYSEGLPQKVGPLKATLPITSVLRGQLQQNSGCYSANFNLLPALSPPMRHISPDCSLYGQGSPNTSDFHGAADAAIRRTASLDALYTRPTWGLGHLSTILHLDKATQTDESYVEKQKSSGEWLSSKGSDTASSSPDIKIEKVIRQRWQRVQRVEHSVSSQTLSPAHGTSASPLMIPQHHLHANSQMYIRPMRSSVEGLNQEIEKLVLFTGSTVHSGRSDLMFSRGTPEGHRAPLGELFQHDTRSVNTQTPIGDLSSDESHSTSPEDGVSMASASPRINRFLAREPPDGCEKVYLKLTEADQGTTTLFKPCVGFQLRPSLGSAFQPLQPVASVAAAAASQDDPEKASDDANEQ